ncbi:MAG TPA: BMP family ABC transporter substrate-binding protein [Solirubrobacteraceae bacterium]|nr:BMP family ABC transporter substrate-binding protein [Solirubrobacteraceae bacterium]
MKRRSLSFAVVFLIAAVVTACGASSHKSGQTTIGFLYVGSRNDFGYNQAAYQGSLAVKKAFPNDKVLEAENVPETSEAERVMEKMISDGATIIFPTSFGHLQPAMNVARRHPNVTFLHQGGLKTAKNLGTYFGTIYETQYAVGQAAGMATKTNKLGYVVAFPIAQTLLNINAFERGAQSVNPKAKTYVVFTGNWCDPGKQAEAANSLLDQHADVLAQHQDCTKTIVQTAERRGAMSTGYHVDASKFAPHGWLTGSVWDWGPLFVKMVKTVQAGQFAESPYSKRYRGGVKEGIVKLAPFGAAATPAIRKKVHETYQELKAGKLAAFTGPVRDQSGKVQIPAGKTPNSYELENTTYLVQGVVGQIPKG